ATRLCRVHLSLVLSSFVLLSRRRPISPLFPYTTLFRSSIGQCFDSLAMAVCYARGPARPDRIIGSDPGIGLDVAASLSHPIGTACTVPQMDFYCRSSYSSSGGRGNGVSCSAGRRCNRRYQHSYRTGCVFAWQVSYLYRF